MSAPRPDTPTKRPRSSVPSQTDTGNKPGVLAGLPSTRPQRPSARRAAARRTADTAAAKRAAMTVGAKKVDAKASATSGPHATPGPNAVPPTTPKPATTPTARRAGDAAGKRAKASPKRTKRSPTTARSSKRATTPSSVPSTPTIPAQGFEAESEIELGVSVHPPSGSELATSVVELVGELAQSGISAGGRLLKDTLARFPGL
jgi:hypothetical protein